MGEQSELFILSMITRRIMQAHGGRIWVEPNPGGGTRFCFTLRAVDEEELSDGE